MANKSYLVLTAVGADRPGLVSEISSLVLAAGANLEDSRMAIPHGEFALLLLVSGDEPAMRGGELAARGLVSGGAAAMREVEARGCELCARLGLRLLTSMSTTRQAAREF